jgi:2-dehydropantoate 2-reductase
MKFLMVGTGGVGGYFGGRLAVAGEDVHFIARGAHLAAMGEHGLKIETTPDDILVKPVPASETDGGMGPAEVVFIAVKIGDTASAIDSCRDAVGPDTVVISLQNGLVAENMLIDALPASIAKASMISTALCGRNSSSWWHWRRQPA